VLLPLQARDVQLRFVPSLNKGCKFQCGNRRFSQVRPAVWLRVEENAQHVKTEREFMERVMIDSGKRFDRSHHSRAVFLSL